MASLVPAVTMRQTLVATLFGVGVLQLGACGGGGGGSSKQVRPESAAAAAAQNLVAKRSASEPSGTPPSGATVAMVALGDSIFHGRAGGGLCYSCHGADGKGTPLAPPLAEGSWLTGDGSYPFIVQRVTSGMPKVAPYPGPMPPGGGAALTTDQIKAVAAYVYSISRAKTR